MYAPIPEKRTPGCPSGKFYQQLKYVHMYWEAAFLKGPKSRKKASKSAASSQAYDRLVLSTLRLSGPLWA